MLANSHLLLNLIPTNSLAHTILGVVRKAIVAMGINPHSHVDEFIYFVVVCLLAMFFAWLAHVVVAWVLRKILTWRNGELGKEIIDSHIITRCTHIIPPLVLMSFLPLAFEGNEVLHTVILRALWVYFAITFGWGLNSVITFAWMRFDNKENTQRHPLHGLLATAHGIVWIMVAIIAVSIIVDRSPGYLITGMAALSAAMMLIFKDSILGFVSGIQLSVNDMLRVGDWIHVPSVNADGVVEDVTLTVVKLRGWDNTILMLPPYTLVSTSFQNYRGMYEMGRRRIDQSFLIDIHSVTVPDQAFLDAIVTEFPILNDFVKQSAEAVKAGKSAEFNGGNTPVNGTIETNLGLFRAYLCLYLQQHPGVSMNEYIMVRMQSATPQGIPLQIYCFTEGDAIQWLKFEAIQSQIMEHILLTAPKFGVAIYNAIAGTDIKNAGQ